MSTGRVLTTFEGSSTVTFRATQNSRQGLNIPEDLRFHPVHVEVQTRNMNIHKNCVRKRLIFIDNKCEDGGKREGYI
jgi:hypothetical protein